MNKKHWWSLLLVAGFYLSTHLYRLDLLPVFADEAIYIRWSQLIIDNWREYLFFPLNDGKTPLLMWLMVPFQWLVSDQLAAGRLVAVLIGLGQVLSLGYLVKALGGQEHDSWLAMILGSILPFWYFHHRMALTDGLLSLTLTWTLICLIQVVKQPSQAKWVWRGAIVWGLALWSKLPAVLMLPVMPLYLFLDVKKAKINRRAATNLGLIIWGGLILFFSLKLHPAFSQLFSRGGDFLYPWREVLLAGKWQQTIINWPTYLSYFVAYLTWPVLLLSLLGQFVPDTKQRRVQHILLVSAVFCAGPMALLGKVVYPRYFLPVNIFLTTSAVLSAAAWSKVAKKQPSWKKLAGKLGLIIIGVSTLFASGKFIYYSLTDASQIPFVPADQEQYLYKWSSGHGIKESVTFIQNQAKNQTVAVATEGYFGTLPDGILMYLHRQDVSNLYVEGVGYPVKEIPDKFAARAQKFDQVLLLVNSHRLGLDLPEEDLLQQYCRPDEAPCLQIWEISQLVKS